MQRVVCLTALFRVEDNVKETSASRKVKMAEKYGNQYNVKTICIVARSTDIVFLLPLADVQPSSPHLWNYPSTRVKTAQVVGGEHGIAPGQSAKPLAAQLDQGRQDGWAQVNGYCFREELPVICTHPLAGEAVEHEVK